MVERFEVIYFQYLELRFDSNIRGLCSLIYAISLILYIPVVIYIPALAFKQSKRKIAFYLMYMSYVMSKINLFEKKLGTLRYGSSFAHHLLFLYGCFSCLLRKNQQTRITFQ